MIKENYYIKQLSYRTAIDLVIENHYLHRTAPCSFAFGLIEKRTDIIVGVVIYGTPCSAPLRRGVCGVEEKNNVIELTRLWVDDNVPRNGESFLIGNTIKLIDKEILVSYAEIQQGHIGYVYQSTNWIYTGLSAKRSDWVIEGIEKHGHTIADKYTSKELREKFGDKFKIVPRPRKHRYIFFNTNKRRKKELIKKLRYPIKPYPKGGSSMAKPIPTREVKVRLWNRMTKRMYPDVTSIDFKNCVVNVYSGEVGMIEKMPDGSIRTFNPTVASFSYSDSILLNYTGVNDFDGVEIYEGDILLAGDDTVNVACTFDGIYKWGVHALMYAVVQQFWLKVIGNIWENPELMNPTK